MWHSVEYETFELLVGAKGADGYPVTVIQSPAGEAGGVCDLDPAADEWQAALRRIEADDTDARFLAAFGRRLFDALFPDPIALRFRASLGLTRGQGKGLRVRLRLEPPELAALPWEYMCDGQADCFLSISPEVPLVRYVPMPHPSRPIAIHPPLRVLVVLASPSDLPPLDVARERGIIVQALDEWVGQGVVQLQFLERGVVAEINEAMRRFRPHVFHFVGHGQYDEDRAYVVLEDQEGCAQRVEERTFREFFLGVAEARLAVLNACQTARTSSARPLAGIAPRLLQRNLSAVVAMQYPIADDTAAVFTRAFYRSLAQGYPVDGAIAEARKDIFVQVGGDLRDWGVPVLFLRAQDGQLFEWAEEEEVRLEVPPPPEPASPPVVQGFVGRKAELAYFADKLAARHLAVIAGMPGVGKTALAVVLARRVSGPGKTFWHTFHEGEGIEEVIWALAGFLYWQGRKDLWQMLQGARQSGGQPPPPAVLFDYLFQMLRGQGFTLCLDDLDYVDDDPHMDQFLERLRPALQGGEVTLIVTAQRVPSFVQVDEFQVLAGLSLEDTVQLLADRGLPVQEVKGTGGDVHSSQVLINLWNLLPIDMVANLHARTEGNASLLTLSVDALKRTSSPGRFLLEMFKDDDVERFLIGDIDDSLTEQGRAVMCAVAVLLGYAGTREAIEAVLDGENARRPLRDLRQRYLLNVREGERGHEYSMNSIVRYFYYDALSRRERQAMHLRAGAYYESEEPDALKAARHYERAREVERTARVVTDDVWALVNQGQARALCSLLERFEAGQVEPELWAKINIAMGVIYDIIGKSQLARQSNQEALSALVSQPDLPEIRELRAQACRSMGEVLKYESPREALEWLNRGLSELAGDSVDEEAALHLQVASVQITMGDNGAALCAVQRGLGLLSEGPSQSRIDGLINLGAIRFTQGDLEEAKACARRALEVAQELHDHWRMISIWSNLGIYKYVAGDRGGAIVDYRRAWDLANRLGSDAQRVRLGMNLGIMYLYQGDHEAAEGHLSRGLDLARGNNLREFQVGSLLYLALLRLYQGEARAAEPLLVEAERLALEIDLKYQLPEIYRGWAQLELAAGQSETALKYSERSLRVARELEAELEEGMSLRVLGQALLANGQLEPALAAFERSLSLLADKDPYEAARTKVQWGLGLLSGGDVGRGTTLLKEARSTFQTLGARHDEVTVDEALQK